MMDFINGMFIMNEELFSDFSEDMVGLCCNCGEEFGSRLEPDARNVHCEHCKQNKVYGIEELLLMGRISFEDEDDFYDE